LQKIAESQEMHCYNLEESQYVWSVLEIGKGKVLPQQTQTDDQNVEQI